MMRNNFLQVSLVVGRDSEMIRLEGYNEVYTNEPYKVLVSLIEKKFFFL